MINLDKLFEQVLKIEKNNVIYYNINHMQEVLAKIKDNKIEVLDAIITPFYISEIGILEIYDYELNIRLVNKPNEDIYILTRTGKTTIDDIKPDILEKMMKCYMEIVIPHKSLSKIKLDEYINFVKTSLEIRERIENSIEEFDDEKLFVVVY